MQKMASSINFKLQQAESTLLRRGSLKFTKKNKTLQTPACIAYTLRGAVPHLVADNLKLLPIEVFQVSLEQFLEQKEPSSFKYPHGIHKYLHLENQVIFFDNRDPLKLSPVTFNTDKHLSVESHGGVRQITPELWADAMKAYRPDLAATMADLITDVDAKTKRIKKSVDRSLRWLDENLVKAKELDLPVFAHVVGHSDLNERIRSAQLTAERDVQGFVINVLGLENEKLSEVIKSSTENLPQEKPRVCYGLATPEGILQGVLDGIDVFDGSYAYKVTQKGKAITFKFGDEMKNDGQTQVAKTISLWDEGMAHAFDTIDPCCGCDACTRPHTKAYIHHLLDAHEMLGPILLMSHNVYQLERFMASVRRSIENNRFEKDRESFLQYYNNSEDDQVTKDNEEDNLDAHLKKKRALLF